MFLVLRAVYDFFYKGRRYLHSTLYKEATTLQMPVFWAWAPKAWMLVTTCLAPHPCAVCCTKKHKPPLACKLTCRSKSAVNTSVFGMIAAGSDVNVFILPPHPPNHLHIKLRKHHPANITAKAAPCEHHHKERHHHPPTPAQPPLVCETSM